MGAKWSSTIGYERRYNSVLQISDKAEFIRSLTHDMPPAPDHFSRCSDINRHGPAMISDLPVMEELSADLFKKKAEDPKTDILEIKIILLRASQHLTGSWHLDLNG
jgi:hypothetical protein